MNLRYAKRSEDTEQINVASWAAWNERQYPELKWLHHIPNGGSRNKAEAVKLFQSTPSSRKVTAKISIIIFL